MVFLFFIGAFAQAPFWGDQGDGTFKNPVLWADYNNLDVIRQGSDFYMTAATHHFMGMPILHSKDMVNWTIISRIYRRLDLSVSYNTPGQAYQRGTWAPAIRFNGGRYYVYICTPDEGLIMSSTIDPAASVGPVVYGQEHRRMGRPLPVLGRRHGRRGRRAGRLQGVSG